MKKILWLMLVNGLLIAFLAGSALANPASSILINKDTGATVSDQDLVLKLNVPLHVQFELTAYTPSESGITYNYGYKVTPWPNENKQTVGSSSDVVVALPNPASFYLPPIVTGYGQFLDPNTIDVTLVNSVKDAKGAPANYKISIGDENFILTSASTNIRVPEFPTVALPVAAVLGLIFVFGRKKERL
jgi:hypothetical protein